MAYFPQVGETGSERKFEIEGIRRKLIHFQWPGRNLYREIGNMKTKLETLCYTQLPLICFTGFSRLDGCQGQLSQCMQSSHELTLTQWMLTPNIIKMQFGRQIVHKKGCPKKFNIILKSFQESVSYRRFPNRRTQNFLVHFQHFQ